MAEKLYYSIGEVADLFQVNPSLIRFWEKEFPQLRPSKNDRGKRFYTSKDIEQLRTIYILVKEKGFTLQGAREHLSKGRSETKKEAEILDRLNQIRKSLVDLRDSIEK